MLGPIFVLYLLVGCGVAVALYLALPPGAGQRWFQVATALVFWPLYLPLLLAGSSAIPAAAVRPPEDGLDHAIARVDGELEAALQSLDGWAESVLINERERLHELRSAWVVQARRIREMDSLLARPEYARDQIEAEPALPATSTRLLASRQVVQQNVERLSRLRERNLQNLLETLSWVRELVSMIHLAKFSGAPASRAEELVGQIAATVEGLSELSWQLEEPA